MPWNIQPPPELGEKAPTRVISKAIASLRLLCGIDGDKRGRVLRTDTAGNLQVVIVSGLGTLQKEMRYWISGNVAAGAGVLRFYNMSGTTLAFQRVYLSVSTAPTGAGIIVDVNRDGVTIFAAINRPTIAAGGFFGSSIIFQTVNMSDGSYLTFDIDQVGSIITGANLVITVLLG